MRRTLGLLASAVLLASLAACGGRGATAAPTVTVVPSASAEVSPGSDAEALDLVVLASSGGHGVAEPYAALAAEALGREVRAHEHIVDGVGPNALVTWIQSDWADDAAEAEIIVFNVSPIGVVPASHLACIPSALGGQFGEQPPATTSVAEWQAFRDPLDRVYDEIWRLRAGQPTILRVYGSYAPWLARWREAGVASECMANEEVVDQVHRDAAEAAGAVFVSWLDLFNGPAHDVDPVEQGWIAADGIHTNDAGRALLVKALAGTGWEASEPPS